jgi:hypothetical protein
MAKSLKEIIGIVTIGTAIVLLSGCGKGNFLGSTSTKELDGIVYDQSKEKIILQGKQGGKLDIYTEDNNNVYSNSFGNDEAVEADTKNLAEQGYRAGYEKEGEIYSGKFIIERKRK